jgi:hypothetical protein
MKDTMVNNIEKFGMPKSMQKHTLEEGVVDYEEQQREATTQEALEMSQKVDEIIDSFYAEGLEQDTINPNFSLSEKLSQYPKGTRNAIFGRWLEREPKEALWHMDKFGSLPSHFQKDIAECLANSVQPKRWTYNHILQVFDKITDRDLHQIIVHIEDVGFSDLAKNRDKLPFISDEQILKRAEHDYKKVCGWYDWAAVIPYIDKFPSVDKQQAIEGAFTQTTTANIKVLIIHREKLGLSERELIDIFIQHRYLHELLKNAQYIGSEYHQEIVDAYLERLVVDYSNLWRNSGNLRNVDIQKIWQKRRSDKNADRFGIKDIVEYFEYIQTDWLAKMPQGYINLLRFNYPEVIAKRADEFGQKLDREELLNTLLKKKQFDVLIKTAERLGYERNEAFANRIIGADGASDVIRRLDYFPRMSSHTYLRLVQEDPENAIPQILKFDGITKEDVYKAVTTEGIGNCEYIIDLLNNPAQISGLQLNQEFAEKLVHGKGCRALLVNLEQFKGIDYTALANNFIAAGKVKDVICNIKKFKGIDHQWLADKAIEKGEGETLIVNYQNFQGLDDCVIIQKLLKKGGYILNLIAEYIETFPGLAQDRTLGDTLWHECLRYPYNIWMMVKLHKLYSPPLDQTFSLAYDLFGEQLTLRLYATISAVKDGSISKEDMRTLSITKTGETGINQLRQSLNKFKSEILGQEFDAEILEKSLFYRQYYTEYVRYTGSEWGEHDEQSFDQTVATHNRLKHEGRLRELPKEYVESGEVKIAKVDRKKQEAFQYSEQFLSRFGTLQESIAKALKLFDQKRPLSDLVERADTKRKEILQTLKDKLEYLEHPKAVENLQKRIEMLEGLDLRSVKNFQSNFEVLSQFSELHEELRQLVFYYALQKNRDYREPAKEVADREKPKFDDVQWMINFIEHVVNEETWAKYFIDERAAKLFRKLVNVNALNEEFTRAQNQTSSGTVSMEFIPTRGLLMEFSGHIADACWASKYNSIAESFPNFSTVVLVQNRGTKHERLAGAGMLIETIAHDGTPLLVIRGLNPIENVINSLNVEDFYQKFTDYITQIAKRIGRQPAIVIDDHPGGSASNRPVLFQFLSEKKNELQRVTLASKEDTSFNGYNIVDCTYNVE